MWINRRPIDWLYTETNWEWHQKRTQLISQAWLQLLSYSSPLNNSPHKGRCVFLQTWSVCIASSKQTLFQLNKKIKDQWRPCTCNRIFCKTSINFQSLFWIGNVLYHFKVHLQITKQSSPFMYFPNSYFSCYITNAGNCQYRIIFIWKEVVLTRHMPDNLIWMFC